jgi:ABC-type nitrate/sulfonate/bicarbonate transport system substrate-binding protein
MPHSMKSRFAFLTTLAAATAVPLTARNALGQSADLIRVGIGPSDQVSPMVYAGDAGIYKKYGLNVEIVLLPTGNALLTAVAGGSLELTMSSSLAAVTAISRGVPLTVIGNLSLYNSSKPDLAMLVLKDSAIHSAKDLEGKTLSGVALQDINTMATNAWLDKLGVDRSTIKYVEIPASATLAVLQPNRGHGQSSRPRISARRDREPVFFRTLVRYKNLGRRAPRRRREILTGGWRSRRLHVGS